MKIPLLLMLSIFGSASFLSPDSHAQTFPPDTEIAIGSLNIAKPYCSIESGGTRCSIFISWTSSGSSTVCLWRIGPGLTPAPNACGAAAVNHEYPWADERGRTMELRYGSTSNYAATSLLDSQYVWGVKRALDFSSGTGSNYYWHNIDSNGCSNNDPSSRYAYDVLSTLHTGTIYSDVSSQLSTMKANGHDILRIPFSYRHCAKLPAGQTGYENPSECPNRFFNSSVASDLGFLPSIALDNLADLLELTKQKGINQVILAGFPIGSVSSAAEWTSFNEAAYQENKSVLFSTRDFVENASLSRSFPDIVWELENELVPASNDPDLAVRLQYAQRLWEDWVAEYGTADSLGYSVIATNSWHVNNRMQYLDDIYGDDLPDFIDIHIYSDCDASDYPSTPSCESEQEVLQSADSLLRSLPGFEDIPIAIGEMWHNDSDGANSIATAMADRSSQEIGRSLIYVSQWPRKRIHRSTSNCFQEPPYAHSALGPLP